MDQVERGPRPHDAERQIVVAVVLAATLVLAYFYAADNYFFSTRLMSQIFQRLLMVEDFDTAWLTLGVCALAACWNKPKPVLQVIDFLGAHELAVALAGAAALAVASVFVYHGAALSMDEYAAVLQAKIFAAGRMTGQVPPSVVDWLVPPGFNGAFLFVSRTTGTAIEAYWPGFSLLLAPFELIGAPFLCNAALAGGALLLIHRITFEITGERRAAGWAVAFTLASGTFAANAVSYYSMQAHLTLNLLFAWLLMKPTPRRAFGAGAVGALALLLHNPLPHALFAAPWIVALLRSEDRGRRLLALAAGYLPLLLVVGGCWLHVRSLVTAGGTGIDVVGSGATAAFSLPDKSMLDMRVAAAAKMWVWAVPGLFVLAALGRWRRGGDAPVRLLAQSAVLTFAGYLFVIFDQGHGWGYRYFHSAWGVVPILAACAFAEPAESKGRRVTGWSTAGRLAAFAGAAAALNLAVVVPFQLLQIDRIISSHSAQLPAPHRPGNDVYFVHPSGFYPADLVQMDPFLRSRDLVLWSRGPAKDAELRRQNWPAATLVNLRFGVEEWNLGPAEQRRADGTHPGDPRFAIAYAEPPAMP